MKSLKLQIALTVFALLCLTFSSAAGQQYTRYFDAEKMRQRVKTLSSDEMEGRAPGNAGGIRATRYIADQLKSLGLKPGNGKSFFQNVSLIGVKANPSTRLYASAHNSTLDFRFGDEFVATTG
ncbi:MAG: hypothetical protein C4325_08765 [Blastocatellia bacterium]